MKKIKPYHFFYGVLFATGILLCGCSQQKSTIPNHPGYLDSIFIKYGDAVYKDSSRFFTVLDSAYNSIKTPGIGDLWDKYNYAFSFFYYKKLNYENALLYTDSLLLAVRDERLSPEYVDRYAKSLFYKGDVLAAQKHYLESFNWYYKAKEILSQKNDSCSLTEYNHRLAATSFQQEKYIEAANYYKQFIKDILSCNQTPPLVTFKGVQGNLDNIGIAYVKAGMYDSAEIYFTKALSYIKENEPIYKEESDFMSMAKAVVYGNYADIAIHKKKTALAEYLLKECIRINDIPSHAPTDAAISRAKLAKLYLDNGRINEAETVLQKLTLEQCRNFDALTENYYLLYSRLAEMKGDYKTAYRYLSYYREFSDSLETKTGPVVTADMQQTIDNISRQYQMDILEKDNARKSNFLLLMVVITIMAIVIIFLIWTNNRRSKKSITTLLHLNDSITLKNKALLQTLAALEQSHASNNKLIKVVAHDLRGPLGAITSIAELSRDGHVPVEKYKEVMGIIFKSGAKALSLANDLLIDLQSLGKLTNLEPLNVADQLMYCVELYENKTKEKKQTIILETIPAVINADREKLWRVFSNLIGNAVKFSREGGEISIAMQLVSKNVLISFKDHGIGIPEELKDRIFEPTEATTRRGTFGEASFGLGLSIARHIILQHNGKLWFESNEETGTTFFVLFPLSGIE